MLKLENIKYLYNSKAIDGLHGISLEINTGEVIGLMGPSGCGKSTLAKLIAGQISDYSGDLDCRTTPFYLEEKLLNLDASILDNFVNYAHGDTQDQKITKARMACSDLEITNYINSPVSNLSMGQKQRVLLGLALVSGSQFVILDEPFSHLEAPLKKELVGMILPILKERETSLLWISHDQDLLLSHCEKVMVMNYGKILQLAKPEKLYFNPSNLFTADFLGLCNKEILKDNYSTVWEQKFKVQGETPLLIIRPEAISLSSQGVEAKLLRSHFEGSGFLNTLQINGFTIFMKTNKPIEESSFKVSFDSNLITVLQNV